jgi:hypothetical protein
MNTPPTFTIRPATARDADALQHIATLDSQEPVAAPALIGEIDGTPAAALSLADGRAVADPFRRTAQLVAVLRLAA